MLKLKRFLYNHSFGISLLPIYLAVNISNKCNRSCNFCPYHSKYLKENEHTRWVKRQSDYLNYKLFENWIKKLGIFRKLIKHIAITGKGEPTMHKSFFNFCMILEKYKIPFSLTTNGDIIKKDYCFQSYLFYFKYLTEIRISLYETDGSDLWLSLSRSYPQITLYNQTGKELKGIKTGYKVVNEGTEQFSTVSKNFNKIDSCQAPFTFMTINTDGSIVPCYSYYEIGNIYQPFLKIWNGIKIRTFRKMALKMNTEKSDCLNCGICLKR